MAGSTKLLTAGGGGVILTPASSIASDVTVNIPAQNGTLVTSSASGSFTTSNFNSASTFGFKNRLINGAMAIAQRGNATVSTNTSTYGGCDRWRLATTGFSTISGTLSQAGTIGGLASISGFVQQFGVTTTGSGTITLAQRIESLNSVDLNGSAITISLALYHDTGSTLSPTINIYKANAQDNFSATTFVAGTTVSLVSGARTTFTYTVTLGATDASNGIELVINIPVGAVTGKFFQLSNAQLEKGSVATSFDFRSQGTELALCQRYYQTYNPSTWGFPVFVTYVPNGDTRGGWTFIVTMRASPSVSFSTTSWGCIGSGDAGTVVNVTPVVAVAATTINGFSISVTNPSVFSGASTTVCSWGTNANPTYYASAEL